MTSEVSQDPSLQAQPPTYLETSHHIKEPTSHKAYATVGNFSRIKRVYSNPSVCSRNEIQRGSVHNNYSEEDSLRNAMNNLLIDQVRSTFDGCLSDPSKRSNLSSVNNTNASSVNFPGIQENNGMTINMINNNNTGQGNAHILNLLTSHHFVPTQEWPCNATEDAFFIRHAAEEIHSLGGQTTISKLRGLLKHRFASKETIKSVPLKALLAAYPKIFTLNRNNVYLTSYENGLYS